MKVGAKKVANFRRDR